MDQARFADTGLTMQNNECNDASRKAPPHVPDTAQCLECDYLLRGLPEPVCPECGRPFNPADPDSFRDDHDRPRRRRLRHIQRLRRRARPYRRNEERCVIAVTATVLVLSSNPAYFACYVDPFAVLSLPDRLLRGVVFAAPMMLGVTCVSALWRWYARRRLARMTETPPTRTRPRLRPTVAVCCLCGVSLLAYPWTQAVRFHLSRRALEQAALVQIAGGPNTRVPRWIGLYRVRSIAHFTDGQVFMNTGCGNVGFLFEPRGRRWSYVQRSAYLDLNWSVAKLQYW